MEPGIDPNMRATATPSSLLVASLAETARIDDALTVARSPAAEPQL